MSGPEENVEPAQRVGLARPSWTVPSRSLPGAPARRLFVRLLPGGTTDAEDLTEQAFLQAYPHFDRARRESDGRPLRPWLIRIAHNLASNFYRDRSRRPQTPLENADPIADEARDRGCRRTRGAAQAMANLEHLPDDRREALIMRFALGMDNREIARALVAPRCDQGLDPQGDQAAAGRDGRAGEG